MQDNDLEQERLRGEAAELESRAAEEDSAAAVLATTAQHSRESIGLLERELADQSSRSETIHQQMAEQRQRIEEIDGGVQALEAELSALLKELQQDRRQRWAAPPTRRRPFEPGRRWRRRRPARSEGALLRPRCRGGAD